MRILVLNGPNLNLLGEREPDIYGRVTLRELEERLRAAAGTQAEISFFQSNHEGELIDQIHRAKGHVDAIIFNPGAFTHYSVALRDAVLATGLPVIEVHLSNIYDREEFRRHSVIAPVCRGQISGLGVWSYLAAVYVLLQTRCFKDV